MWWTCFESKLSTIRLWSTQFLFEILITCPKPIWVHFAIFWIFERIESTIIFSNYQAILKLNRDVPIVDSLTDRFIYSSNKDKNDIINLKQHYKLFGIFFLLFVHRLYCRISRAQNTEIHGVFGHDWIYSISETRFIKFPDKIPRQIPMKSGNSLNDKRFGSPTKRTSLKCYLLLLYSCFWPTSFWRIVT